ncbi:MAG: glycosyltransferase family 2 protein [Candidatus Rokubacteria bacterium]|nr:glycosyltransferase family 2 protein [Candidatus Rokubacteria bacterium]
MRNLLAHVGFWLSAIAVSYPYVLYPALLSAIARRRRVPTPPASSETPSVSVIIAAYNEAAVIARKLDSTLSQDYPASRLEVVVVSDGSTDRTAEIVAACPDSRIRLLVRSARQGKSAALNCGVREARGDILVFTDANALFAPGAIRRLVEPFADPRVGLVSGQGLYGETGNGTARAVANGYVRFEALVKSGEGVLGFVAGADGAIYAIRRALYEDLPPTYVNDLLHPIAAALAGYKSRFDPEAYTVEPASHGAGQELQRHVRIIAQGFAILIAMGPQLARRRRWKALWMLASHRFLRWISAFALAGVLGTSLAGHGLLFKIALLAQGVFYATAAAGWLAERTGRRLGLLAAPYYFCVVSAAGALGLLRFVRGGVDATWAPRGDVSDRAVGAVADVAADRWSPGRER